MTPLLLGLIGVALALPVPALLARSSWPYRSPAAAIVMWQSLALAAILAISGAGLSTALWLVSQDDPAAAVAWMANTCHRPLRAGDVVISGGLTSPVDLHPGTVVTTEVDRLGGVTVRAAATPQTEER